MCSFRNSLIVRLPTLLGSFAFVLGMGSTAVSAASYPVDSSASYFPLNVGNSWSYRCSTEGEFQFTKILRLASVIQRNNVQYFRSELQVKNDRPLVYYMFVDDNNQVYSTPNLDLNGSELLITANPKVGEIVGAMTVAGNEMIDLPALKQVNAIRIENFDRDDPNTPAEQRMEWMGRYYARGIGLVMEADGLGGECVLVKYRIHSH